MTDERQTPLSLKPVLKYILCGILIGGGGILPGVSGGVLCVLFGIYRPMMALFAHPFKTLKKHYDMFIPVIIGGILGFVLFARILETLFGKYELYATWAFIGLIAGAIPSMFKDAGKNGRSKNDIISMIAVFAVVLVVMFFVRNAGLSEGIEPNTWWFLFCGIAWGLSIVVPGMTSSSLLLSMGLYLPLTAGVASLDFAVIIPWGIGLAATILLCAKLVDRIYEKHYSVANHCIVGVVAAFTIVIIPTVYSSALQVVLSAVYCIVGFGVAFLMNGLKISRD